MQNFKMFDVVRTTDRVPQLGLPAGSIGTIGHIHGNGAVFEVDFPPDADENLMMAALLPTQLELVNASRLESQPA